MTPKLRSRGTPSPGLTQAGTAAFPALLAIVCAGVLAGWVASNHTRPPRRGAPLAHPTGQPPHAASPVAAATDFARTYLSFVYGRSSAAGVGPTTPAEGRSLSRGRAQVAPAELQRQVIVRGLQVARKGTSAATASIFVDDGVAPPYVLTFDLSFSLGRWLVDHVGDGSSGR